MREEFFCKEQTQPEIIQYMEDRERHRFYLDSYIDENYTCLEIAKNIIALNNEGLVKPKPIYLYIYCYGGDIEQAFMLCDVIENSKIPVYTVALGPTMSSGCVVFLAGHKRFAYPHANLMLHYGKCVLDEEIEKIDEERKKRIKQNYERSMQELRDYICRKIPIDPAALHGKLQNEWYITREEMLSYKIVDEILAPEKPVEEII